MCISNAPNVDVNITDLLQPTGAVNTKSIKQNNVSKQGEKETRVCLLICRETSMH